MRGICTQGDYVGTTTSLRISPAACASAQISTGTSPAAAAAATLISTSLDDFIPITTFAQTDGNAAKLTATLSIELRDERQRESSHTTAQLVRYVVAETALSEPNANLKGLLQTSVSGRTSHASPPGHAICPFFQRSPP